MLINNNSLKEAKLSIIWRKLFNVFPTPDTFSNWVDIYTFLQNLVIQTYTTKLSKGELRFILLGH